MSERRLRLLFVSPVLPASSGNGLAMRAGMTLTALAARYDVWLLVVPLYASPEGALAAVYAGACRGAVVLAAGPEMAMSALRWPGVGPQPRVIQAPPARWAAVAAGCVARERFEVVHVFRMAALPFAEGYLWPEGRAGPRKHLGLDDIESRTQVRLAALYRANGDPEGAYRAEAEARRGAGIEDGVLATFDRVYVCSEGDREALRGRGTAELAVLPNAVPLRGSLRLEGVDVPRTYLFAGTLGYYPNEDAALWFCRQVWPAIQEATSGRCRLLIAGSGAGREVRALGASSYAHARRPVRPAAPGRSPRQPHDLARGRRALGPAGAAAARGDAAGARRPGPPAGQSAPGRHPLGAAHRGPVGRPAAGVRPDVAVRYQVGDWAEPRHPVGSAAAKRCPPEDSVAEIGFLLH